ncbi:hypothetical protein GGI07_005245 [Coemansia sp. Benny D115]|nr:hypothetical protein GGI07_005245 [Coemansia sp. Benny D115]
MLPSIKELLAYCDDRTPPSPPPPAPRQRPGRKTRLATHRSPEAAADVRQYKCGLQSCLAVFKRPEHLKRHMLTHTQSRPFRCDAPGCGKRFSRRDNYVTHTKKHGGGGSACPSESASSRASSSGPSLDHAECSRSRSSIQCLLNNDVDQEEEEEAASGSRQVLSFAALRAVSPANSPLELLASASSQPPALSPPVRSAIIDTPTAAVAAKNPSLSPSPEAAPPSAEAALLSPALSAGALAVVATDGDPTKPFMCSLCSSRFGRLEHVKRHHLVHTGQRKYECPSCSKSFARKDNMVQHLRAHERKKPSASGD